MMVLIESLVVVIIDFNFVFGIAGGEEGEECTLILTEGDSAKV